MSDKRRDDLANRATLPPSDLARVPGIRPHDRAAPSHPAVEQSPKQTSAPQHSLSANPRSKRTSLSAQASHPRPPRPPIPDPSIHRPFHLLLTRADRYATTRRKPANPFLSVRRREAVCCVDRPRSDTRDTVPKSVRDRRVRSGRLREVSDEIESETRSTYLCDRLAYCVRRSP